MKQLRTATIVCTVIFGLNVAGTQSESARSDKRSTSSKTSKQQSKAKETPPSFRLKGDVVVTARILDTNTWAEKLRREGETIAGKAFVVDLEFDGIKQLYFRMVPDTEQYGIFLEVDGQKLLPIAYASIDTTTGDDEFLGLRPLRTGGGGYMNGHYPGVPLRIAFDLPVEIASRSKTLHISFENEAPAVLTFK